MANIEVHGIGGTEQSEGADPAQGLAAFLDFVGKDPLVAFHAPFDSTMLRRAVDRHLGIAFRRPWLDLADVAPLAWPKYASRLSGLDDWLEAFAIPVAFRQRAIALDREVGAPGLLGHLCEIELYDSVFAVIRRLEVR